MCVRVEVNVVCVIGEMIVMYVRVGVKELRIICLLKSKATLAIRKRIGMYVRVKILVMRLVRSKCFLLYP